MIVGLSGAGVVAGTDHTCARITGGRVACWGDNGDGQLGDHSHTNSTPPVRVQGF